MSLTLSDLKKMPKADATCVLMCAGNGRALHQPPVPGVQWSYGAVGNAKWSGVRLRDVLDRAGVHDTAKHLHLFGSDDPPQKVPPFHRSIEMQKALDDAILAWQMNGEPLPVAHGAPLRLVVPGWAGDHWMKWLVRLSPQQEPAKGFYMDTAYRWPDTPGEPGVAFKPEEMHPVTELAVKSNITTAPKSARAGEPQTIRGFAFSGAPDIAKVEVSDDDGATWSEAKLDARHDPFAWRLWSYRWTPRAKGKSDPARSRDRQPRRDATARFRVEPERLPLQRLADGRRRGDGMKRMVLVAILVTCRRILVRRTSSRPRRSDRQWRAGRPGRSRRASRPATLSERPGETPGTPLHPM